MERNITDFAVQKPVSAKRGLSRIDGLDITRGLAVFGMMFMNFKIAFRTGDWSSDYSLLTAMEGRFGVLFIFMAGLGVALMNRKALAEKNPLELKKNRIRLLKRALFLLVVGMVFSLYWFADILHFYSFYLLIGVLLIRQSKRVLAAVLPVPVIVFVVWNIFFSWDKGWDFVAFSYIDLYTLNGFFRNLLFNGFHPVFPWISFFILGMIIGKTELRPHKKMVRNMGIALAVFIATEILSWGLNSAFPDEMVRAFISSRSFPPFPLFVVSAGAMSVAILYAVILLFRRVSKANLLYKGLKETGKMVLTHYVVHLLIGIPALFLLSMVIPITTLFVLAFSLVYFALTIISVILWRKRFPHGPLEMLMRKISG